MRERRLRGSDDGDAQGGGPRGRRVKLRALLGATALALALAAVGAISAAAAGGAPTVETERAEAGRTSLVLNASVNPNASAVGECYFEYGTSEAALESRVPCSYSPGSGETPVPVTATVQGLPESTPYYFRIYAKSAEGESFGAILQTSTLPTAPHVANEPAKPVADNSATLNAVVDPNDSEVTECYFEWGSTPNALSNTAACANAPGAGSEPVAVSAAIGGLEQSTTYYYRIVARNAFGLEHGGRANFGTLPNKPRSNTEPASAVTHTTATLRGFVTPNGALVEECYFLWGANSFANSAPCEQTDIGSGEEPVAVTAQLKGLNESTTYDVRLVSGNRFGTDEGGITRFTTLPATPKAQIRKAQELADESAVVRGRVNPEDAAISECVFEYGTTPALGKSAPCSTLPPAGERFVNVSAGISGLTPSTEYLVRVKVRNVFGVAYSNNEKFTTFVAGLLPVVAKIKPAKGPSSGGTHVTIKGENLLGAKSVTFGETETTDITSDTADTLTVISPAGVGAVDVIVTTASGESKVTSADRFTYGAPQITGLSPNTGPKAGGTEVTVTGYGFEPGTEGTKFTFGAKGEAGSVDCASTTTCTMLAPAAKKPGTVTVHAVVNGKKSSASSASEFTYTS